MTYVLVNLNLELSVRTIDRIQQEDVTKVKVFASLEPYTAWPFVYSLETITGFSDW